MVLLVSSATLVEAPSIRRPHYPPPIPEIRPPLNLWVIAHPLPCTHSAHIHAYTHLFTHLCRSMSLDAHMNKLVEEDDEKPIVPVRLPSTPQPTKVKTSTAHWSVANTHWGECPWGWGGGLSAYELICVRVIIGFRFWCRYCSVTLHRWYCLYPFPLWVRVCNYIILTYVHKVRMVILKHSVR